MRNITELHKDVDSLNRDNKLAHQSYFVNLKSYFMYEFKPSARKDSALVKRAGVLVAGFDTADVFKKKQVLGVALNQARNTRGFTLGYNDRLKSLDKETNIFTVEIYRKYTMAISCLVLFLIGAPLGAIIKKGGFGMPVLISIIFFIIFYVISNTGEKWAKESIVEIPYGMWAGNGVLFLLSLFFLVKARNDSNMLDFNFSAITRLFRKKEEPAAGIVPPEL